MAVLGWYHRNLTLADRTLGKVAVVSRMLDGTVIDTAGVVGWLKQEHGPVPVGYTESVA